MANQNAQHDANNVATLLGVDSTTGETRRLLTNSSGAVLVSINGAPSGQIHLNDDQYLTMGNTAGDPEWEIGYKTSGLVAPYALITVPDGKATVITNQANAGYDYLNIDPGVLPHPLIVVTNGEQVRNRNVIISFAFDDASVFAIQGSNGNDLDETPHDADGVSVMIQAGESGSLGGNGGNVTLRSGSAAAGSNGDAGDILFDLGNNNGGSGRNGRLATTSTDWLWKLSNSGSQFAVLSSDDDDVNFQVSVSSTGFGDTTQFENNSDRIEFQTKVSSNIAGNPPSIRYFTQNSPTNGIPATFIQWTAAGFSGASAAEGLIDYELKAFGTAAFTSGNGSGQDFISLRIDGRPYSDSRTITYSTNAVTLSVGKPSAGGGLTFDNLFSIETDGSVLIGEELTVNQNIGVGTSPTIASITTGASGGLASLYAPDGAGAIIQTNSSSALTTFVMSVLGNGWTDEVQSSTFQATNAVNSNLVIAGGGYAGMTAFGRLGFLSGKTTFYGGNSVDDIPVPSGLVEIVNSNTAIPNLILRAAGGQNADFVQLLDGSDVKARFTEEGKLSINSRSLGAADTSFAMFGGDLTLDGNGTELMFNIVYDTGNVSYKTVSSGFGAVIAQSGSLGSISIGLVANTAADTNVTPNSVFYLAQDESVGFGVDPDSTNTRFSVDLAQINLGTSASESFALLQSAFRFAATGTHSALDGWRISFPVIDYNGGSAVTTQIGGLVVDNYNVVKGSAYSIVNYGNILQYGMIHTSSTSKSSASSVQIDDVANFVAISGGTTINYISTRFLQGQLNAVDQFAPVQNGHVLTLSFSQAITITNKAGTVPSNFADIRLDGGGNFTCGANGGKLMIVYNNSEWQEITRSTYP